MNATCWSCGQSRSPYQVIPAITFCLRYFRCHECDVEWTDRYDLLPWIYGQLAIPPVSVAGFVSSINL